jgi:hypothetical protein
MTDYAQIPAGELVRDCLGHWYRVVAGGPYHYTVQPLTPVGHPEKLQAIGGRVAVYRSDIRRDGE